MLVASQIVTRTETHVRAVMAGDSSGHDWWHVDRVRRMACRIAEAEGADALVVELAALLHDVADAKVTGDEASGARVTREWLTSERASPAVIEQVVHIVRHVSYTGAGVADVELSLAGQCVRDADRLDAMGAIGVARAFAYGGHKGRAMHEPGSSPQAHLTVEAYRQATGTTVNHFAEKLLLLRDRMGTDSARGIAEHRHSVMLDFLGEFHREWAATDAVLAG